MQRLIVLLLLAACLTAAPARAENTEARDICLCRQVIARTLCKDPSEVDFIDRYRDSANYTFTVFYAKKEERFVCNVAGNEVRIKGNAWVTLMRTVTVTPVPGTGCLDLRYSAPECRRPPVRCCAPQSAADVKDEKATDFWSRPIPELLQDELTTGIAREPDAANPNGADQTSGGATPAAPGK